MARLLVWLFVLLAVVPAPSLAGKQHHLGVGDSVEVRVYGQSDLSGVFRVTEACRIELQLIGWVEVCGRTTSALAVDITERLADGYLVNPSVVVSIKEHGSRRVEMKGHVRRPGVLVLEKETSLSEAITLAGGPLTESVIEAVVLSGSHTATYYLPDLASGALDVQVKPGDVVVLKPPMSVQVIGEVKREGPVPFREGMTVTQALGLAGGPTQFASLSSCYVVGPDGSKTKLNLRRITKGLDPDIALRPDDKLVVRRSVF